MILFGRIEKENKQTNNHSNTKQIKKGKREIHLVKLEDYAGWRESKTSKK